MGWFDKKTWQKRRKIKDLQGDLLKAEREGKYVVEQGLFFAELEDMGDATMMIFGAVNELSGSEEGVIRSFFDRNGFSVDTLRLDKTHTGLAEVEIIPPEEVTRWVGRSLKAEGYKLVDDSEEERPAELSRQILPLSSLVRSIIILFCERVQHVIGTTRIKMNKEGDRLLHWLPGITGFLSQKVDRNTVEVVRPAFADAFEQFFLRIGQGSAEGDAARRGAPTGGPIDDGHRIPSVAFPQRDGAEATPMSTPAPGLTDPLAVTPRPSKNGLGLDAETLRMARQLAAAEAEARMFKALIGASPKRCVSNSEALLAEVHQLFDTSATCLMVKVPNGHGLTIHAQAGKRLAWGEGGGEGYAVSSTVLGNCIKQRATVTNEEGGGDPSASMLSHKIDATAASPIIIKDEIVGIVYLDRRGTSRPFDETDCLALTRLAQIFREYPELTLGLA